MLCLGCIANIHVHKTVQLFVQLGGQIVMLEFPENSYPPSNWEYIWADFTATSIQLTPTVGLRIRHGLLCEDVSF